jgi:hypothetical protein
MADYIITLIHGTFARGADWCKNESSFAQSLTSSCDNVTIEQFDWSGLNLHFARLRAGERLARHLRASIKQRPTAKRVLIAHSHGGNVAMYALRDREIAAEIDCFVSLGTPFISIEPRPLRRALNCLLLAIAIQSFALPVILWVIGIGYLLDHTDLLRVQNKDYPYGKHTPLFNQSMIVPLLGMTVFGLFASYLWEIKAQILSSATSAQGRLVEETKLPICSCRTLCISVRRDEARFALGFTTVLSELAALLLSSFLVVGGLWFSLMIWATNAEGMNGFMAGFIALVVLSVAPFIIGLQIWITAQFFRYFRGVAFGETFGLRALLLVVTATRVPASSIIAPRLEIFDVRHLWHFTRPLAHSMTYTDPRISTEVAKFIFERV